jgi:hypothetical protein
MRASVIGLRAIRTHRARAPPVFDVEATKHDP